MKQDIILCGVGGQGILSIATVIAQAATCAGVSLKQAEVHGMSQRGGDVQSNLRLSDSVIFSDLIPRGQADLIISMEPMEALRYLPYLSPSGRIVTSSKPFLNIPDYPPLEDLYSALDSLGCVTRCDIEQLAADNNLPKGANMILLGMAAGYIGILSPSQLKEAVAGVFASKGEAVVASNLLAFDLGNRL